jgi:hypothetical protein
MPAPRRPAPAGALLAACAILSAGCRTLAPAGASAGAPAAGPAVVLLSAPVDVENGVGDWRNRVRSAAVERIKDGAMTGVGYNECAETTQVPGAFVCLSYFALDMNKILGRAGVYAEGGFAVPRGTFAKDSDPDVRKLNLLVEGQDLKSEDLLPFFEGMRSRCAAGERASCPNPSEALFYENVLKPVAAARARFVILGVAVQAVDAYQANLGHEMMHAQYMLLPSYKETIDRFWDAMPAADKDAIRKLLAENAYDPSDEFLMRNEFQAYLLEPGADDDLMRDFVPKYRAAVVRALAGRGLVPIQVR